MGNPVSKLVLVLCLLAAASLVRVTRIHAGNHHRATQLYEDIYYLPPKSYLKLLSLGHDAALADLIWLKGLVYYGEELGHRGEVANLYRYAEAMLELDPHFRRVYRWVPTCALYRTGTIGADDALKAIEYLEQGIKIFPDDPELAWDLGALYSYELPPLLPRGPERDDARRKGLPHLEFAALRGVGPRWLVLTNATQLHDLGKTEQAIRQLSEIYSTVSDPKTKRQIEQRLAALKGKAGAETMRRVWLDFEARRLQAFPYVSQDLFMVLGDRPPFDGMAQRRRNFDPVAGLGDP